MSRRPTERLLTTGMFLLAATCAIYMFFVMHRINQTRIVLQNDGIDIFNYTFQNDRNTNEFAYALLDYREAREQHGEQASAGDYIEKFDILWSSFKYIDKSWLGAQAENPEALALLDAGKQFVDRYENRIVADVELGDAEIDTIVDEARALSRQVDLVGNRHYQYASHKRDEIAVHMDTLYAAFWRVGGTLIVAGAMLMLLLARTTRRVSSLLEDSEATRRQLARSLEELHSGDNERRAQNRFIAAASHDLRQPMQAMGLYLGALSRHVNQEGARLLEKINRSTEALNQLLDSLLDISKLDAGVVNIHKQVFRLDDLFELLEQEFRPQAQDRGLQLDVLHSGLQTYTDKVLLNRILRNLLSNALNNTRTGGITLSAKPAEDGLLAIEVADTGTGIPKIEQSAIFNEYYQLDNPERDRTKGLGLGLSIVRRLVRMLGISLTLDSTVGKGSTFRLRLPQATQTDDLSHATPSTAAPDVPVSLRDRHVLVIDDEREIREGTRDFLQEYNCDVLLADSGDQALSLLEDACVIPDVIVADYRLRDEENGVLAVEQIRQALDPEIPAIIITGDTSPERIREAKASGHGLLHKPVSGEELLTAITRHMRAPL